MSFAQERTAPLPPPPPAPPSPHAGLHSQPQTHQASSPLRRIAVQPPIINTALAPPPAPLPHGHTPASATPLSLSFSPYAPSPSTYAASPVPPSPLAMRTPGYNPQQWARSGGIVGGQYVPHSATQTPVATSRPHDITGMEASMPSPPPPYSPGARPHAQNAGSSPHMSAAAFVASHPPPPPPPSDYTPSPSSRPTSGFFHSRPGSVVAPQSATSAVSLSQFPPPPPATGSKRSASRDKLAAKFSLSKFRDRTAGSPGPSNIESLRINTNEALQRPPASPGIPPPRASHQIVSSAFPDHRWSPETQSPVRAPGARRAASTGVLGSESRTPIDGTPTPIQGGWGHGAPLPPPPPGPPPNGSRSQSLGPGLDSSIERQTSRVPAPPTRRPGQSILTPVPPTPVGWQDEQLRQRSRSPAAQGLQIDTSPRALQSPGQPPQLMEHENGSIASDPTASTSDSSSTLHREPRGDQASRGIRERRSESRAARERAEPNNNPWAQDMEAAKPANLVLASPEGSLNRRGAVTRNTPRSGGGIRSPKSSQSLGDTGSSTSTPRLGVQTGPAPTPPFSPGTEPFDNPRAQKQPMSIPSKTLPTPPIRLYGDDVERGLTDSSGARNRSTSLPTQDSNTRLELSLSTTPRPIGGDQFAEAAVERHRRFLQKEMAAQSDQDRLEVFAEYIVHESRLRRDRYSAAFDAMAGDIVDLTRDLWRSYSNSGRRSVTPSAQSASIVPSGRRSQASSSGESPDTRLPLSVPTTAASPASSASNFTPHTEPPSPSSAASQRARDASWNYKPVLSPIPSMAMSTVPDEEDSRGRSASRWWEASNDGGSSGIGSRRLERSKRESKYMGLPKEARESLQWIGRDEPSPVQRGESSSRQPYGTNEYPPEKVGLHEETPGKQTAVYYSSSAPATPDPRKLDVSRLVTLPPPYPRHHPAVNNSHPDLASIRNNLRNLSDLEEVKTTKEAFHKKINARKEQENASLNDRRSQLRYNIQENIQNGVMSYADAANAENDFEAREHQRAQEFVQNIFDTFQTEVANPLHAMFCERITKAAASLEHLKGRLSNAASELNPNQTQEEGDEQPELLEMLTLLKWLFEAREQLHKEMFELEDERNDLYKDIIVLPYTQTGNEQKIKEATAFFRHDAQDRKVTWEKEMLKRYEEFMNVIEQNVTRGVETQLSAFWDIAPGLLTIVQKVPQRLDGFDILIPPQEYEENPSYYEYPLQYLYTLLAHAGRSAYQFIESQINLLCLLHEVKTGVMNAGSRLLETQRIMEGEDLESVDREMKAIKEDEEGRLTDDLKEKVGLVESQWNEALGGGLAECKMRVEAFLTQQGGWEDCLKE